MPEKIYAEKIIKDGFLIINKRNLNTSRISSLGTLDGTQLSAIFYGWKQ